ncbi:hypothetical protein BH23ACT9_BH23ACT9_26750 [soil metagenome]
MTFHRPSAATHTMRRRLSRGAVIAVTALLLAACDGDLEGEQPDLATQTEPETGLPLAGDAQPAAGSQALVTSEFGEIDLPTGAEPLDEATVENGVTVQNFMVTGASAQQVIDEMRATLQEQGWLAGEDASTGISGEAVEQAQTAFTRDGQTLLVTVVDTGGDQAGVGTTGVDGGGVGTQLSLQLSGA